VKIVILWRRHRAYFDDYYARNAVDEGESWERHLARMERRWASWPGLLARYMRGLGHDVKLILVNDRIAQSKWAREHGVPFQPFDVREPLLALEQLRRWRPDVLWLGSLFDLYGDFVRQARAHCRRVVTWVGSPFIETADVDGIDVLLTENPRTLASVQDRFERVVVTKPGFDRRVVERLGPLPKTMSLTFVGGLSLRHMHRAEILAALIRRGVDLSVFGYTNPVHVPSLCDTAVRAAGAAVRGQRWRLRQVLADVARVRRYAHCVAVISARHFGPVFGADMIRVLAESRVTLNVPIDIAGGNAGNMRLVEATGAGTCLVTERAANLAELFEAEREVVTYAGEEELVEKLAYLREHPAEADAIARAGQERVFRDHTIERMYQDIEPALAGT